MNKVFGLLLGLVLAGPSLSVAAALSPKVATVDVATAFGYALTTYCAPSVSKRLPLSQWPGSSRTDLSPAPDSARKFLHAPTADVVWDVHEALGIVFIEEKPDGECRVDGYGPPVGATFNAAGSHLVAPAAGFHALTGEAEPDVLTVRFYKVDGDSGVLATMSGSDPGMAQHQFRYSTFTASVSRKPIDQLAAMADQFANPSDVATAFSRAVTYYCANAIVGNGSADRLPQDSLVTLVPITTEGIKTALKLGPNDKAWFVSPGLGSVTVIQRSGECSASAHGVLLTDTLDRIVGAALVAAPFNMSLQPITSTGALIKRRYVMEGPPGPLEINLVGQNDPSLKGPYAGRILGLVRRPPAKP